MDEITRDPREDLSLIRRILARTVDDMKTVAPWFTGFGVLWLCYSILNSVLRIRSSGSLRFAAGASVISAISGWLFYIGLAVGFLVCRRWMARQGRDTLARKLVDLWGIAIFLFIGLSVLLILNPAVAIRLFALDISQADALGTTCALLRSFQFFLLPMLPLLATAVFLENRRMLLFGAALAVLAILFFECHILLIYSPGIDVSLGLVLALNAVACLLDILPGVMLLVFGRQLKRA